jgi:hypothetical protein
MSAESMTSGQELERLVAHWAPRTQPHSAAKVAGWQHKPGRVSQNRVTVQTSSFLDFAAKRVSSAQVAILGRLSNYGQTNFSRGSSSSRSPSDLAWRCGSHGDQWAACQ